MTLKNQLSLISTNASLKARVLLLLSFIFFPVVASANSPACPLLNGINVHTAKRVLNICKQGIVVKSFKVAIGYKGVGKKQRGDNKTPLGLYNLAYPRSSSQFKVFIPIMYPTSEQLAAGYTGRDVGIHGPTQSAGWLKWLNNLPYSTRGCIAVGKNNYIENVATWVKANPKFAKILII